MNFLDLFAGIGGFRRGLELAGHKCVGFCEWDKYATASYTSMHLLTDEQRKELADMSMNVRRKIILEERYRNGEFYTNDIRNLTGKNIPRAQCWTFGAPCQDFSVAGRRAGLEGNRSSLVREVFRILEELREADRPEWLIYENVKGMLSSNRGWDFFEILSEMDRLGYDSEWQNINSAWFVPQNRQRIYTIGHLRKYSGGGILPIAPTSGENSVSILGHRDGYRRNRQVFSQCGITETLDTCGGGGREPHVAIPINCGLKNGIEGEVDYSSTLLARDYKGIGNQSMTAVAVPVLTPERADKRQNGRRFKENGEPMFTLTAQDTHGVVVNYKGERDVYAVWSDKYQCYIAIRKLTPRECFRLQGWTDDYFEKAAFVNSDTQLYKQAGNGVTVQCVEAIGHLLNKRKG